MVTNIFQAVDHRDSQHVGSARWCDLVVAAPATADLIAKLAAGICDDPVTLTAAPLPRGTPVLLAPAMNAQMWESPIAERNMATLTKILGYQRLQPEEGWQACRTVGAGRMSEPEAILVACGRFSRRGSDGHRPMTQRPGIPMPGFYLSTSRMLVVAAGR